MQACNGIPLLFVMAIRGRRKGERRRMILRRSGRRGERLKREIRITMYYRFVVEAFTMNASRTTAATRIAPWMISRVEVSAPIRYMPLVRLPMTREPSSTPQILPLPPVRLAPPSTQAAIEFIIMLSSIEEMETDCTRDAAIRPAKANTAPERMKAAHLVFLR